MDQLIQNSIYDYLDLPHRTWCVEFESNDFGVSLTSILELPPSIYALNKKMHFWVFMQRFLEACEISFIFHQYEQNEPIKDSIELALIGSWNYKQYAIPLWILNDTLLGFEIISSEDYIILDSEPLTWNLQINPDKTHVYSELNNYKIIVLEDNLFHKQKMCLKIKWREIFVSEFYNELKLFERIAQTEFSNLD